MKLAERVIQIHEDVKTAESVILSFLKTVNRKTKAVEDFFFDSEVKGLVGREDNGDEDDPYQLDSWQGELNATKFSESLLTMCEGEDVTIEDCKEVAKKIPSMVRGKQFQIDSVTGKIYDNRGNHNSRGHVRLIVVELEKCKYDESKDTLTADLKFIDVDMKD